MAKSKKKSTKKSGKKSAKKSSGTKKTSKSRSSSRKKSSAKKTSSKKKPKKTSSRKSTSKKKKSPPKRGTISAKRKRSKGYRVVTNIPVPESMPRPVQARKKKQKAGRTDKRISDINKMEKDEIARLKKIEKLEQEIREDLKRMEKERIAGQKTIEEELKKIEGQEEDELKEIGGLEKHNKDIIKMEKDELGQLKKASKSRQDIYDEIDYLEKTVGIQSKMIRTLAAAAGGFVGFALGVMFFNMLEVDLEPLNLLGILLVILATTFLLYWKREEEIVAVKGIWPVVKKVVWVVVLAFGIELVSFALFNMLPADPMQLAEMLIITSYLTIAGAVAFSLT